MKVSLICTVRNEVHTVHTLVSSVEAQSMRPDEMIVVDAGSTDGTLALLESLTVDRPWLKVRLCDGVSIARGRNIAIDAASNEIVAMTDAGVRLHRDWLRTLTAPFESNPAAHITGGWTEIDPHSQFERWMQQLHTTPAMVDRETFLPSARCLALRKSVWEAAGGFPEWLTDAGEDTLFLVNVRKLGYVIELVPEARVQWRPRSSLRAYFVQQYRYGTGDGEARLFPMLFLKRLVLVTGVLLLIVGPFAGVASVIAGSLLLGWGFFRLIWPKRRNGASLLTLVPLFVIMLVGECGQVLGYLRGLAVRKKHG